MEVDQAQRKYATISNGNRRFVTATMDDIYPDEEDEGDHKRRSSIAADLGGGGGVGRFYGGWPSSRIVRVSRATGGKDRHSKVLTSKGLRDRRVRLSVNTAIQFYDLQDRLGFDQPSKAVEWLLKAAASSITELPPMLNSPFPDTPNKQMSDEKKSNIGGSNQLGFDSVDMDPSYLQQQQVTKSSACSSTSETSKGSGLSLSRSETRVKARERAKERTAEKNHDHKDNKPNSLVSCLNLNPISQTSSFTELLSGGLNNGNNINNPNRGGTTNESNFLKSPKQWSSTMDYFTSGLLGPRTEHMQSHFAHSELQQFSFAQDHNLNFSISTTGNSSGLVADFNRGTLQSNSTSSPSPLPHLQRFPPIEGSSQSFFIGTGSPVENHHQLLSGFDAGRLQLYYGDAHANDERHAGHKGKGKD